MGADLGSPFYKAGFWVACEAVAGNACESVVVSYGLVCAEMNFSDVLLVYGSCIVLLLCLLSKLRVLYPSYSQELQL